MAPASLHGASTCVAPASLHGASTCVAPASLHGAFTYMAPASLQGAFITGACSLQSALIIGTCSLQGALASPCARGALHRKILSVDFSLAFSTKSQLPQGRGVPKETLHSSSSRSCKLPCFNFKLDDARCASCLAHQDRRRALRVPFGTKDQATHDHITDCALSAFCSACTSRPSDSYSQRSVQPELQLKVRPNSHLTDCDETPPDGRSGRPESPLQSTALYDPYFPRATTRTQGTAYNNPGTIGDDCIDTRGRWGRFTITRGRSIKLRTGQIFSAVFYLGTL